MSSGSKRPRAPGWPPSTSQNASPKKGSVRAARERMAAGQMEPEMPLMPEPPRFPFNGGQPSPQPSPRSANFPPSIEFPPPSPGPAPSAPLPSPGAQWPLVSEGSESPPPQRREPPQRPPRPSYVPSMLDPSRQDQGPSPQPPSQPDQWDEDFLSPTTASSSRPLTTSSTGSVSSLGSIPDFPVPVPVIQQISRRSPNIGPPPSARRGPSSYYSQTLSYVSPIAEESEQSRSHGSYASSNVIPRGHSAFYLEDGEGSPTDDEGPGNSGRSSRAEDHTDQSGLVRQASMGKKHKPALTTIKSTGSLKDERKQKKAAKVAAAAAGLALSNEGTAIATPSSFSSGTAYLDESSSGSSDSVPTRKALAEKLQPTENVRSPSQQARDSDVNHVLEGLQKGGAIDNDTAESMKPGAGGLATRVGQRRPPRLNVDAVKEAETRGSLTSLPDLIRRATRLASNLDRGKTASRLGMDWFTQDSVDQGRPRNASRRSGSLSDMLNNFPSPGMHTPTGEKLNPMDNHRMSQWPNPHGYTPSPLRQYAMSDGEKPEKKPRRCCGMRLWVFIGLLIILLILIAAAVVIPIALIVLPNDGANNTPADTSNAIASCNKSNPCQNGGEIFLNSKGQCSCVCSNGFTGAQCTQKADNACTTMPVDGVSQKSTVGFAVVPLLNQADDAFGVPLNASIILSQFSTADVSCALENALVTFNGQTGEVASNPDPLQGLPNSISPSKSSSGKNARRTPAPTPTPSTTFKEHRVVTSTSKGLIVAATATTKPQKTESSTPPAPSNSGTGTMSTGTPAEQRLDFARVAVLFVLQQAGSIQKATAAQGALQQHFKQVAAGSASASDNNVDATNGFTVDFDTLAVRLPGGGSVGGWGR